MPCKGEIHVGTYPPWLANYFLYLWDLHYLKNMVCYLELYSLNLCPVLTCHQNTGFYPFLPVVFNR